MYSCRFCSRRLETRISRVQHEEHCHTGDTPSSCGICFVHFDQYSSMMQHVVSVHDIKDDDCHDNVYSCPYCGVSYHDNCALIRHLEDHDSIVTNRLCDVCCQMFDEQTTWLEQQHETKEISVCQSWMRKYQTLSSRLQYRQRFPGYFHVSISRINSWWPVRDSTMSQLQQDNHVQDANYADDVTENYYYPLFDYGALCVIFVALIMADCMKQAAPISPVKVEGVYLGCI